MKSSSDAARSKAAFCSGVRVWLVVVVEEVEEGSKIKQLQIIVGTLAFPGVGAELCRYTMPVPVLGFAPGAGEGERGIPLPAAEGGCSPPPSEPYERVVVLPETVAALCVVLDVFRGGILADRYAPTSPYSYP